MVNHTHTHTYYSLLYHHSMSSSTEEYYSSQSNNNEAEINKSVLSGVLSDKKSGARDKSMLRSLNEKLFSSYKATAKSLTNAKLMVFKNKLTDNRFPN